MKRLVYTFVLLLLAVSACAQSGALPGANQFSTDFSRRAVPLSQILSGGPPKDGIPAIDRPQFESVRDASRWLEAREPVLVWREGKKIYPIQILTWHEIVNDDDIVVTFCPLCNTGIGFERRLGEYTFDFGTTGRLRFSNLIMYDRQTETWWQQADGEAIIGELMGERLETVPLLRMSWDQASRLLPDARVLSRDTGFSRPYGRNPYAGYDNPNAEPFLFQGPPIDGDLNSMDRVISVQVPGDEKLYAYSHVRDEQLVQDRVGSVDIVIFYTDDVASALDSSSIVDGKNVGALNAFDRELNGTVLEFRPAGERFRDTDTGSIWDSFGTAQSGPLEGQSLRPLTAIDHFWFSGYSFSRNGELFPPGTD